MKATLQHGKLQTLKDKCSISIPGYKDIQLKILPEISDSKQARYNDEPVIGRSFPIKTYAHSENRVISMRLHFQVVNEIDLEENVRALWAIQSATYPRSGEDGPYRPPPICRIQCGRMLGEIPLCAILESYQVQVPTDCVWDEHTLVPYYFYLNTTWQIVYAASRLPNQELILNGGIGPPAGEPPPSTPPPVTPTFAGSSQSSF